MSPLTTHVLDVATGCPAAGIEVKVERQEESGSFRLLGSGVTNADGRVVDLLDQDKLILGTYRLRFETGKYHEGKGFFPYVEVVFVVNDPKRHYHVPILLSPFGFSTYRGS